MTSRSFWLAPLLAIVSHLDSSSAGAQATRAQANLSSRSVTATSRWFDDPVAARALSARILTTGAPSTYQIITVPIPDQLPRRGEGQVEIVAREGFTILGAHKWTLSALEGKTRVIGTIGIPANAHAGLVTAADVYFQVPGSPTIAVAIEIDVTLVRDLAVRLRASPLQARAGSRMTFSYELVNTGNATESVETSIVVPKGWNTNQQSGASASVSADESVARRVVVSIPKNVGTGSFFLRLDILDKGIVRSSLPLEIDILDALTRQASAGPIITIAVGRAIDATGRGSTITTASVRGPIFDSVRVDARFSFGANAASRQAQALSRIGSYQMRPSLVLSSPSGRLEFGTAGKSFSDLTGLYADGRGVALDAHRPGWSLVGLGATSNPSPISGKSWPMLGIRGDVDVGPMRVMSSVSHLRDGDETGRQLDALGLGASLDAGLNTTIQTEVARRRFAGETGTGWSTEVSRDASGNSARVRVTHAPGGSRAFARAVNEFVGDFSQALSKRLGVSGSVWRSSDATVAFARLQSRGWAIRPEYRVLSTTTIGLEAHSTGLTAVTGNAQKDLVAGYGSSERQVGISVNTSVRQLYASASVTGGSVSRSVVSAGVTSQQRSPKILWNGMTSWRGSRTVIEAQGRMEETLDLGGAVRRQSTVMLRGNRSIVSSPGQGATADWEVQQIRGFSVHPVTVVRGGLSIPITEMVAVKLYAERNPLFATSAGASPWTYALRVEQSTHVPMVRTPGTTGYVYRDLNGNNKRDAGEPGVDGAVLTRGGETAVTNASGKYRLAGNTQSSITLDEASLPLGWIRQGTTYGDISVGSSLSAEIRFFVAPRSGIEDVEVDLSGMRAIARDASGKEWVARMTGPLIATFDALPPGTYTLELDMDDVAEPLIPRIPLPPLHVTPLEPSFVTVILDPRPLRIWRAETVPAGSGG